MFIGLDPRGTTYIRQVTCSGALSFVIHRENILYILETIVFNLVFVSGAIFQAP